MSSFGKTALAMGVVVAALSLPAMGQSTESEVTNLKFRLDALEREVTDMRSSALAINPYSSGTSSEEVDQSLSTVLVRLDQLEMEIRNLTGQIEEINYKIQQNTTEIATLSEDVDYRLQALEGGEPVQRQVSKPSLPSTNTAATSSSSGPSIPYALGSDEVDFKEKYDTALAYLKRGDYAQAETALRAFIDDHGDTELASNAYYWLGESYYVQQKYEEAGKAFLEGIRNYPNGKKAPDSMLKLGMSLAAIGQKKEACTTFTEISRRYPNASQTIIQRSRNEKAKAGCV